jgi:hypothetical protein
MRIYTLLLCLIFISCDSQRSKVSRESIEVTGADVAWASDLKIYKKNIGSLVTWPVRAVGFVVIGDDGAILSEHAASQLTSGAAYSPDTVVRLSISRNDQAVKCRLGVGGVTVDKVFENEFGTFRGWSDGCEPVDGIVLVTTDGENFTTQGDVLMRSKGKKLGFKLYKDLPK